MFSTTGPLMPKCVQSSEPSRPYRDPTVHAQAERCRLGDTRERRVALAIEDERRKRGRRVDVAVPETTNQVVSETVAAGLRERASAGGNRPRRARRDESFAGCRQPDDREASVRHRGADLSRDARCRSRCQAAPPRQAARRAPCATDWYPETACRPLPRAAERRAPRKRPRRARPEMRAARSARRGTSLPRSRAR